MATRRAWVTYAGQRPHPSVKSRHIYSPRGSIEEATAWPSRTCDSPGETMPVRLHSGCLLPRLGKTRVPWDRGSARDIQCRLSWSSFWLLCRMWHAVCLGACLCRPTVWPSSQIRTKLEVIFTCGPCMTCLHRSSSSARAVATLHGARSGAAVLYRPPAAESEQTRNKIGDMARWCGIDGR